MGNESAWDLTTLNSGLLGALLGVVGAVVISTLLTLYSLRRTERANRSGAFEQAMLKSAEELSTALVELRYKFDPVLSDNYEHELALAPEHVIRWAAVARSHASALAVDGREYREDADRLSQEIILFTAAALSAAGRDAHSRRDAYGWHFERDESYDSLLQAADWAMAGWADAILDGLADLRRGVSPRFERPGNIELTDADGRSITSGDDFRTRRWFPMSHLILEVHDLSEDGVLV